MKKTEYYYQLTIETYEREKRISEGNVYDHNPWQKTGEFVSKPYQDLEAITASLTDWYHDCKAIAHHSADNGADLPIAGVEFCGTIAEEAREWRDIVKVTQNCTVSEPVNLLSKLPKGMIA